MIDFSEANIRRLAVTWVGNKSRYEGISVPASTLLAVNQTVHELLIATLVKPFEKTEEFFCFFHEEDLSLHPVYQSVISIFTDEETMSEEVKKLTNRLYENSELSKFRGGEYFIALMDHLKFQDESVSALALFKVNSRDPFLQTERTEDAFMLSVREGIGLKKVEVAALILNMDESEGYRVCAVDTISKKDELSFWRDAYLRIHPIEDHYFHTRNQMGMMGEFITQKMPQQFEMDRTEKIDLLNRTAFYFKENEHFELEDYAKNVFPDEEKREAFKEFRTEYAANYNLPLEDQFDISNQAVKKELKVFKSVIKLDKNFHIYVHGRRDWIERGYDDDKGMRYYKVYFEDEE